MHDAIKFLRREFFMKKTVILLIAAALFVFAGCSRKNTAQNAPAASPTSETMQRTRISESATPDPETESTYFANHEKIENTSVYVPETSEFLMQAPADSSASYYEPTGMHSVNIPNAGDITIYTRDEAYTPMTQEELNDYVHTKISSSSEFSVEELVPITAADGSETGRSYTLVYENGFKTFCRDYASGGSTVCITAQTSVTNMTPEAESALLTYMDSIMPLA